MYPMYRLLVIDISIKDIMEAIGHLFTTNHTWKIHVRNASRPLPQFGKETIITGHKLYEILKEGIEFTDASFSALEGSQILFRIAASNGWVIHTTRKHWVTFFEEKFRVAEKEEMDPDLPEFDEFMQD
ncbi:MAG: hypothetical protein QMD85_00395 [Candidatus Aenigmarchaeota archaeon]|nr:hypothetical protein [Candidatus Aenigmarchaeota archaeon]MDI6721976.1 hypothetical protein [Candidatus Aenigmarchaeota archaeon]